MQGRSLSSRSVVEGEILHFFQNARFWVLLVLFMPKILLSLWGLVFLENTVDQSA